MTAESWLWNYRCGIIDVESLRRNVKSLRVIIEVESLMWNHSSGTIAMESLAWNHYGVVIVVEALLWKLCESLLWNHCNGIIAVESLLWNHCNGHLRRI